MWSKFYTQQSTNLGLLLLSLVLCNATGVVSEDSRSYGVNRHRFLAQLESAAATPFERRATLQRCTFEPAHTHVRTRAHTRTYTHNTQARTHTYAHALTHAHTQARVCACTRARTHKHTHTHVRTMHAHVHTRTRTNTHTRPHPHPHSHTDRFIFSINESVSAASFLLDCSIRETFLPASNSYVGGGSTTRGPLSTAFVGRDFLRPCSNCGCHCPLEGKNVVPASCAVAFIGHFLPMDTLESLVKIETGMIAPVDEAKARLCKRGW